jgi:hypothetical protein
MEPVNIDPMKKYNKQEIANLLDMSMEQLKEAQKRKIMVFAEDSNYMYGLFFFQFLKLHAKELEELQGGKK